MTTMHTTFAVTAEDDYRRARAAREFRTAGGTHHRAFTPWWRRSPRPAAR